MTDQSAFGQEFASVDQPLIIADFRILIEYKRGTDTVSIYAVQSSETIGYDDRTGIDVAIGDASFWINTADIDFGSGAFQPKMHDRITTPSGDVYEVLAPGDLDSEKIMRRVPVVKVEYTG